MKKTSNSKKGTMPAGAPKGMNPLAYFNSLKGKTKTEPKQTLKKAQAGIQTNGDPEDMMINKPGYGAKKNVYTRPEPTPATKNTVYQGPISEKGNSYIERAEAKRQSYPLSTNNEINDIVQSDRNPKNSKRIEKGRPYVQLSRDTIKTQKQDKKDLWKNIWKEIRNDK